MTEMDPREIGIDSLLRRSMDAPVPTLPADFDQRVMRKVRQGSALPNRYGWIMLIGYGLVSVVTSAVVMRGQGLDSQTIALMIAAPLILVATVSWARRTMRKPMRHSAR